MFISLDYTQSFISFVYTTGEAASGTGQAGRSETEKLSGKKEKRKKRKMH